MMLWAIYLSTTVVSLLTEIIQIFCTLGDLSEKGYVFSSKKVDNLKAFMGFLYAICPGLNMYMAYRFIKDEEEIAEVLIKDGIAYKPEEKKEPIYTKPVVSSSQAKEKIKRSTRAKTYDEMTIEEKRKFLLEERERILSDLYSTEKEINTLKGQK